MKYLIALLLGLISGGILFLSLLYFNPFAAARSVSPLAVTSNRLLYLSFSPVPGETLVFTNDGESVPSPKPEKVLQLWESTIKNTDAMVVVLANSRGEPAGIGIKFQSDSEATHVLNAQLLVDSVWHIHLPGRGTMLIDQRENYWSFVHDVVIEAHKSSGDNWRGSWNGVMTIGPNALGTGRVTGGNGEFAGVETEAVESLTAKAYSVATGPVAMSRNLSISLPDESDARIAEAD